MAEAVETPGGDVDWVLALAASAVAAVAWAMLWIGGSAGRSSPSAPPIATLSSSVSDVRRRTSGTLVWEELSTGAELSEGDAIFVPPASGATVVFRDGTRLELDENTLVALEAPPEGLPGHAVRVARGDVVGASGTGALSLLGENAVATLESGSAARLAVERGEGARVEVLQGKARLGDGSEVPVRSSALVAGGAWKVSNGWPVRLETPPAVARVYFHGTPPPIDLTWSGSPSGARVQVARDPGFTSSLLDAPATGVSVRFTAPERGRYHWRVVDQAGRVQSETRRLWILEDQPPVGLSPRDGELVAAYLGRKVPFAWSHVVGVRTYEVQVSDHPEFTRIFFQRSVEGTTLRVQTDLREGRYFWRVRSRAAERGESPWSAARAFRYVVKPLPATPELFDPELEVDL